MLTSLVAAVNAVARFFIEIVAVVVLGICVGPLVAVAAVVAWALFAAPKARFKVEVLRLGTQAIVLLGAAVALGGPAGVALGVVVAINSGLIAVLPEPEWA